MSERSNVQRAPRSGGRTAEQRSTNDTTRRTPANGGTAAGGRGARQHRTQGMGTQGMGTQGTATQGTAALKLDTLQPSRVVEADPRPRLRVAPPAPINVPRAPFVALVLVLVIAGVLGILIINTKTNENSFRLDKLREQQVALDNEQQGLQRQIDFFETPGNIQARARQLGLVDGHPAYIRLPDGKIINPPVPGSGELSRTAQGAATGTTQDSTAQGADAGVLPGAGQ
jgi:hypothetical protein